MSESGCIITSLNLYEFSQVNNNEMGVYIDRDNDPVLYKETYDEALRIIRISEEVKITNDRVQKTESVTDEGNNTGLLTTSKLGLKHKESTSKIFERLTAEGYLEDRKGKPYLTAKGAAAGASWRAGKFGGYFLWPETILGD